MGVFLCCVNRSEKWEVLLLWKGFTVMILRAERGPRGWEDLRMCTSKVGVRSCVYVSFFFHLLITGSVSLHLSPSHSDPRFFFFFLPYIEKCRVHSELPSHDPGLRGHSQEDCLPVPSHNTGIRIKSAQGALRGEGTSTKGGELQGSAGREEFLHYFLQLLKLCSALSLCPEKVDTQVRPLRLLLAECVASLCAVLTLTQTTT